MKRIIKGLSLFIVVVLTVAFVMPLNTNALTKQTQYVDIYNNEDLQIDNLYISNLNFKNYSSTSTQAFGLSGSIYNSSSSNINYSATIHYYDSNYNLIAQSSSNNYAYTGNNTLNLISNLSVDKEYTTSRENSDYKIKIGSADYTLTGEQSYLIKYTYNLGKDPMKDYDELYYNLIGTDWDTVIGNITFKIVMPKDFNSSKLGFSSGSYGSTANDKVKYSVNGNTITGSYNGILSEGEALTIRCELPEGYFVGAGLSVNYGNYILFLIPIIFLLISLFICYKFGRDDKVVETVEFYPPQGFNSLEIGFLFKGKADNQDVTSL